MYFFINALDLILNYNKFSLPLVFYLILSKLSNKRSPFVVLWMQYTYGRNLSFTIQVYFL